MTVEHTIEELRGKQFRITKLRKFILAILSESEIPLSAGDLLGALIKRKVNVHKTSVYRELDMLKNLKIIRELQFNESKKRYEVFPSTHHHHIVCTDCGRIEDVILGKDLDKQELKITKEKKFKVSSHSLEFFGLCAKCNN